MAKPPKKPPSNVGYGRPPKETQFKPGCSGNPGGRPKGTTKENSLRQAIREEMGKPIAVNIDGATTKMPRRQVIAAQYVRAAAKTTSVRLLRTLIELDTPDPISEASEGRTINWTFDFKSQAKINTEATFDDDDDLKDEDDKHK